MPSLPGPPRKHDFLLAPGETIAFFPKVFRANPTFGYQGEGYQDLPHNQPELMRELMKEDWPDRQWPARLYHFVRPRTPLAPTAFNDIGALDKLKV